MTYIWTHFFLPRKCLVSTSGLGQLAMSTKTKSVIYTIGETNLT